MPDPKTPAPAQPSAHADERNLVEPAQAAQVSLEDQLKLWWDANRGALLVGAAAALLFVGLWQAFSLYRRQWESKAQAAYQAAVTSEDRLAFAQEFKKSPLAGLALLSLGDEAWAQKDYTTALARYRGAVDALDKSPLGGKARLAAALATLYTGDRSTAATALLALARDTSLFQAVRAEAAYHRALLAREDGDTATFDQCHELIVSLPYADGWLSRLQSWK